VPHPLRASALVPRGFVVEDATNEDGGALVTVRSAAEASACPGCGLQSGRVHIRYRRRLAELPIAGRAVRLMVLARRFYCTAVLCGRRVFAERFDADVLAPWARRTARLDHIVHHLGLASGLWRQLHNQGFRGCLRIVSEWATRRRRADRTDNALSRAPAARTIARMMTIGRDQLSRSETVTVAAIEGGVPPLVEAREIVGAFQAMVRKRSLDVLDPWLERAQSSLVASFANGVLKDRAAVAAAITSPWSNGQTEGQITKLKLVKRQMYGRGNLDLLQARVIGAV